MISNEPETELTSAVLSGLLRRKGVAIGGLTLIIDLKHMLLLLINIQLKFPTSGSCYTVLSD